MHIERTFIPKETDLKFKSILKTLISDYYLQVIGREIEICSFGIFTDSDISGFVIYYNLKTNIDSDSDKWWLPDWTSGSVNDNFYNQDDRYHQLEKIMNELIGKSTWDFDDKKNTFATYKNEMFDSICDVLKELNEEKLFKNASDDFFLLVQESDNGVYEERTTSLNKIMSKEQFEEYQKSE